MLLTGDTCSHLYPKICSSSIHCCAEQQGQPGSLHLGLPTVHVQSKGREMCSRDPVLPSLQYNTGSAHLEPRLTLAGGSLEDTRWEGDKRCPGESLQHGPCWMQKISSRGFKSILHHAMSSLLCFQLHLLWPHSPPSSELTQRPGRNGNW